MIDTIPALLAQAGAVVDAFASAGHPMRVELAQTTEGGRCTMHFTTQEARAVATELLTVAHCVEQASKG